MEKSRVTLYIPTDIWRAFRVTCLEQGTSASHVVTTLIEEHLMRTEETSIRCGGELSEGIALSHQQCLP